MTENPSRLSCATSFRSRILRLASIKLYSTRTQWMRRESIVTNGTEPTRHTKDQTMSLANSQPTDSMWAGKQVHDARLAFHA